MGYRIKSEIFNMEASYYKQKMKAAGISDRDEIDHGEADFNIKLLRKDESLAFSEKTFKDFEDIKTKINNCKMEGTDKYKLIHEERLFSSSQNQFRIFLEYAIKDDSDEIDITEDTSF